MANVLGELFGSIADAIRDKTGETGTMKPSDFPQKIHGIIGGSSGTLTYTDGSFFSAEGGINTIEHNMGRIPDMIVVYVQQVPQMDWLVISVGYSQAMMNSFTGDVYAPSSFISYETNVTMQISHGMETTSELAERAGAVRNVNSSTFTVGGTQQYGLMPKDSRWNWFAISGIA